MLQCDATWLPTHTATANKTCLAASHVFVPQVREKLNQCLMRHSPQLSGVPISVVSASLEQASGAIVADAPGVQCSVTAKCVQPCVHVSLPCNI